MRAALQALAQDQATQVIVLVAKPPAAAVTARLLAEAGQLGKPCVLAFVGTAIQYPAAAPCTHRPDARRSRRSWPQPWYVASHCPSPCQKCQRPLRKQLAAARATLQPTQTVLYGLYCGGTLAQEALWLLRRTPGEGGLESRWHLDTAQRSLAIRCSTWALKNLPVAARTR